MTREAGCPSEADWELAYGEGPDRFVVEHASSCEACATVLAEIASLKVAVSSLRRQEVPFEVAEIRARVIGRAAKERRPIGGRSRPGWRSWPVAVAAALVVAAAVAVGALGPWRGAPVPVAGEAAPGRGARVHAAPGTEYASVGGASDEIVRLYGGVVTVEVDPLGPGQRFRVITDDAEVEVRGTVFEVRAEGGRLASVHVFHGRVEVRPVGGDDVIVEAGDTWSARSALRPPAPPAPLPADSAPSDDVALPAPVDATPDASGAPAVPPAPAKAAPSEAEIAFQRGWTALRSGDPKAAASALARVPPGSALEEDALFWRGVALLRAGDETGARQALEAFRARYPGSARKADVESILRGLDR
jgi:hypothetical protein